MRKARIKVIDQTAVYHCIARVVGGQFLMDDLCKETFGLFMWPEGPLFRLFPRRAPHLRL